MQKGQGSVPSWRNFAGLESERLVQGTDGMESKSNDFVCTNCKVSTSTPRIAPTALDTFISRCTPLDLDETERKYLSLVLLSAWWRSLNTAQGIG